MIALVRKTGDSFRREVTQPLVLAGLTACLLVSLVAMWSATRIDQLSLVRQTRLVNYAVTSRIAAIAHDQESVTMWDDAVQNIKTAPDTAWIDTNIGIWMHDYFRHDEAIILNDRNEIVYAMADGKNSGSEKALPGSLRPLVAKLRQKIAEGGVDAYERGEGANPRVVDLAILHDRPSIVSVMPFVSDSGKLLQASGSEFVLVSTQFVDGAFLNEVAENYLLKGARFSWTDRKSPNEAAYPLSTSAGERFGFLIWQPARPGTQFLWELVPVASAAALTVALVVVVLIRRIRRSYAQLRAGEAQSHHVAFHDVLTGLPNRALLNDRLDATLAEVRATLRCLALIIVDVDHFRDINNTLGHPTGEEVLRDIASRLKAVLGPTDILARIGGNSFAVIKANVVSQAAVVDICHLILARVAQPFDALGHDWRLTVSIGVALSPSAGVDRTELLRKADIALYQAKRNGGNCFAVFSETMGETVQNRFTLERELRQALETPNEIEVVYQPIYSAATELLSGVEVLCRWNHPRLGVLLPAAFVPIAEETGLINRLGSRVLAEACAAAVRWQQIVVAVNVSPIQFRQTDFVTQVVAIAKDAGLPLERLELEITENTLVDTTGAIGNTLAALRDKGIRIALDDFGTGYSSLNYLRKLPVDRLKIDRSFIQSLDSDPNSILIIDAIVGLARAMDVRVTAEGVETREQQLALVRAGCHNLQGYLFSRPVPAARIDEILGIVDPTGYRRVVA